jgi:hypothetical protein
MVSWFSPKTLIDNMQRIVPPTDFESEKTMIARANGQHPLGVFIVPYLAIRSEFRKGTLAVELKNGCMREYRASGLAEAILLVLDSNRAAKVIYKKWGFEDTGDVMPYGENDTLLLYKNEGERFRPDFGGAGRA